MTYAPHPHKSFIVLLVLAGENIVRTWGGQHVTEEFFDNDRRTSIAAGCGSTYYDFISGEPYGKWTNY